MVVADLESRADGIAKRAQAVDVLVVEDNSDVRFATMLLLEDLGYTAIEAGDGPAALSTLERRSDVDLVFSDIKMPGGVSGVELANKVRKHHPDIKLLLCSGYVGTELPSADDSSEGLSLLAKPYNKSQLAVAIKSALSSGH